MTTTAVTATKTFKSGLTDADRDMLRSSFISEEIAAIAKIRRVDEEEGSQTVGRPRQGGASYAGLLFPYFSPAEYEFPREYRLRRDQPDFEPTSDGTLKQKGKYLSPPGRSNMLYFPPGIAPGYLRNPRLPIVLTEGEKKTLALLRLAISVTGASPFVPVGISGVWNWKGTIGKTAGTSGERVNVKGPILDLDLIEWKNRNVTILFDTNVTTNDRVWQARKQLAVELTKRGSNVAFAELPIECGVNGVDDYLGAIEQESGLAAALDAGVKLLRSAYPHVDAKPIFFDQPRPLESVLKPISPIDVKMLPPVLRNWLVPASKVIGCPLDFLVLSAVAIAGSLIGCRARLKPLRNSNWSIVPNIYAGIVGHPSTKKTPALSEARKPLQTLQSEARKAFAEAKADFEFGSRFAEKEDKALRNQCKTAAEFRAKIEALNRSSKPILRRYEANDATSPKLIQYLSENPNGLILIRDELMGLLQSLEADYDLSSRPLYLELWTGAITYDFSRVSDNRELTLSSGTLSILGGIQPSKLTRYVSDAYSYDNADGLPQRFLFAYPDISRSHDRPTPNDLEQATRGLERACTIFQNLTRVTWKTSTVGESGDRYYTLTLDDAAQSIFDSWKEETEAEAIRLEVEDEVFASFLFKLPKNCGAIILIYHCLESTDLENMADRISKETTERAIAYIRVLTTHARRVFALGENRIFGTANLLLSRIKADLLPDGFTSRELKRKNWSGLTKLEAIEDVLTLLADYGWLKPVESHGSGRPTVRYYIHPNLALEPAKVDE